MQYDELPLPSPPADHNNNNNNNSTLSIEFHIRASPLEYALGFRTSTSTSAFTSSDVQWLTTFPSSWMAFAPPSWFVFEGVMFALFATGNGRPWTKAGATVGFRSDTEGFYGEDIPDYDEWV